MNEEEENVTTHKILGSLEIFVIKNFDTNDLEVLQLTSKDFGAKIL